MSIVIEHFHSFSSKKLVFLLPSRYLDIVSRVEYELNAFIVDTNGTGGNKELIKLIKDDPDYAIKNFQFSILEVFLNQDSNNEQILEREKHWKKVLDSKNHGYNDNL